MTTLTQLIYQLNFLSNWDVIYAKSTDGAWLPEADADVYEIPLAGGHPSEAVARGLTYFLEVKLAKEVVVVAKRCFGAKQVGPAEAVIAVIHYAMHDAYLPELNGRKCGEGKRYSKA